MKKLDDMRQKSLAAAVVLVVGLAVSSLLGGGALSGMTDDVIMERFSQRQAPAFIIPERNTASLGLRHEVSTDLQKAIVMRVVDGDTLRVSVAGQEQTVRLIGINAPESISEKLYENTPEGTAASAHLKDTVKSGDLVYLQKDTSETDDYGRLLRYVWLAKPVSFTDHNELKAKMLNAKILADGYAVAHKYRPDDAYFDIFKAIQLDALHAKCGLWELGTGWAQAI